MYNVPMILQVMNPTIPHNLEANVFLKPYISNVHVIKKWQMDRLNEGKVSLFPMKNLLIFF
jgi:hypothetical protein